MKQQVKTGLLAGAMVALLGGQANANLIVDGSFEAGGGTWNLEVGTDPVGVDANWVGKWSNAGKSVGRMLLTDASQSPYSLSKQTGSQSLLSRGSIDVSHVQIVDVSGLGDISNKDWSLSVDAAVIGTVDLARFSLYGFNTMWDGISGAQIDLAATVGNLSPNSSLTQIATGNALNFGLSSAYKTLSLDQTDGTLVDYNYLAVVLTAEVAGNNVDAHGMAWDNVSLTVIPEPATIGLVTVFGGGVLFIRRRFTI